jgi:hypothetical protein
MQSFPYCKGIINVLEAQMIRSFTLRLAPVLAMFATMFSVAFTPLPAQASAYGCSGFEPYYCVSLVGSGTFVNYVGGLWRGSGWVCNAYITAEFFDNNWNWYETRYSGTQWGCGTGSQASINFNQYKKPGFMCSTLHYNDTKVNKTRSVCHQIKY